MTYTVTESNVKAIYQNQDGFKIVDGMVMYPRAMVHILPECPHNVRDMINFAIAKGYLQCVAHIYKHEETFNLLNDKS
jgi:hypothetical protein